MIIVSNDYSFVCKRHNVSILAEELGLKKTEMFKILSFKDSTDPNFTEIGKNRMNRTWDFSSALLNFTRVLPFLTFYFHIIFIEQAFLSLVALLTWKSGLFKIDWN